MMLFGGGDFGKWLGHEGGVLMNDISALIKEFPWASLVAQWLRILLPMEGTRVQALVREDPTCRGATNPVRHSY